MYVSAVKPQEKWEVIAAEVDNIVRARIAGNEAAAAEKTNALVSRQTVAENVVMWAVESLEDKKYGESAEVSAAALVLLQDITSSCPTEAKVIAGLLLRNPSFSQEMRVAGLSFVIEIAVQFPSVLQEVIGRALIEFTEGLPVLRRYAFEIIESLLLRCPQTTKEILLGRHLDAKMRAGAILQSGFLFASFPEEAERILSLVLAGCDDSSSEVRRAAVSQLTVALSARPMRAREIVDTLLRAGNDNSDDLVQTAALRQLSTLTELVPETADEAIAVLRSEVNSSSLLVQLVAMQQLPSVAKVCPSRARELVRLFLERYPSFNWSQLFLERYHSVDCAPRLLIKGFHTGLQACPEMGEEIVDVLVRHFDEDYVPLRRAVAGNLCGLIAGVPEVDDMLVSTLFRACGDVDGRVREAAVGQLIAFGKKVSQESDRCATSLLRACRDRNFAVKRMALRQLEAALELWPKLDSRIVRSILVRCCDVFPFVREEAKEQLPAFLRACPNEATALLGTMVGHEEERFGDRGTKRKSCHSPRDGVMEQRCESGETAKAQNATTKNSEAEKSKKSKRPREDDSEDRERKGPRRY